MAAKRCSDGLAQQRYVKSHRNLLRFPHSGPHPGTPYRLIRVTGVGRPRGSFCFRLNSNKGTKRDMAISLIPFDRLDFRTLGYPQNGALFSPPILGVEFRCCLMSSLQASARPDCGGQRRIGVEGKSKYCLRWKLLKTGGESKASRSTALRIFIRGMRGLLGRGSEPPIGPAPGMPGVL